jgi:hypothetical protein
MAERHGWQITLDEAREMFTPDLRQIYWRPAVERIIRLAGSEDAQRIVDYYAARYGLPPIRVVNSVAAHGMDSFAVGGTAATMSDGSLEIGIGRNRHEIDRIIMLRHEIEHHIEKELHGFMPKVPSCIDRKGELVAGHHKFYVAFDTDYPHRIVVRSALERGDPVPAEVLRAYPELATPRRGRAR